MHLAHLFLVALLMTLSFISTGSFYPIIPVNNLINRSSGNFQGDFTGTYTLSYEGTTLTLNLQQDQAGMITGSLTSTTGVNYTIQGQVSEGVAVGICYDQQGGVYFEAYFAEQQLVFTMIEPDANNMPDYDKAQSLTFDRSGSLPQVNGQGVPGAAEIQQPSGQAINPASEIMNHFAGSWTTMTTNTQTWVTFRPDGTFSDQYESSYSGNLDNQYGGNEGNWGAYNQQNASGTWSVKGTREQGVITIIYNNGEQRAVEFSVHTENGQTYYNEYWFNGALYFREK